MRLKKSQSRSQFSVEQKNSEHVNKLHCPVVVSLVADLRTVGMDNQAESNAGIPTEPAIKFTLCCVLYFIHLKLFLLYLYKIGWFKIQLSKSL